MNNVHLHGALAEEFGAVHRYAINSPREAVRALMANHPNFAERLSAMEVKLIRTKPGAGVALDLDEDNLDLRMSEADLHIIPVPLGSKKGGLGKVLLGVVLIGAAVLTGGASLTLSGILGSTLGSMGLGLALGGISMMLAPSVKGLDPNDQEQEKTSYVFNGAVNVEAQGQPMPIVIGRFRVGTVVLAAGMTAETIAVPSGSSRDDTSSFTGAVSYAVWRVGGSMVP